MSELYPHDPVESRYHRDVSFRSLVNTLEATLRQHQFSPSELREAVMLAATRYEISVCRPAFVLSDDEIREFLKRTGRDLKGEEEIDQLKYVELVLKYPEQLAEILRARGGQ